MNFKHVFKIEFNKIRLKTYSITYLTFYWMLKSLCRFIIHQEKNNIVLWALNLVLWLVIVLKKISPERKRTFPSCDPRGGVLRGAPLVPAPPPGWEAVLRQGLRLPAALACRLGTCPSCTASCKAFIKQRKAKGNFFVWQPGRATISSFPFVTPESQYVGVFFFVIYEIPLNFVFVPAPITCVYSISASLPRNQKRVSFPLAGRRRPISSHRLRTSVRDEWLRKHHHRLPVSHQGVCMVSRAALGSSDSRWLVSFRWRVVAAQRDGTQQRPVVELRPPGAGLGTPEAVWHPTSQPSTLPASPEQRGDRRGAGAPRAPRFLSASPGPAWPASRRTVSAWSELSPRVTSSVSPTWVRWDNWGEDSGPLVSGPQTSRGTVSPFCAA